MPQNKNQLEAPARFRGRTEWTSDLGLMGKMWTKFGVVDSCCYFRRSFPNIFRFLASLIKEPAAFNLGPHIRSNNEIIKETLKGTVINAEVERIQAEISSLGCYTFSVRGKSFSVKFEMILSMIDGKILQTLNETPHMGTCSICGAKPSEMNDLTRVRNRVPRAEHMSMSPLHARIKFMECILKISYKLPTIDQGYAKDVERTIEEARKKQIQEKFRSILGLRVDMVKQGVGTWNDGNTSRRFFADVARCAEITGMNE